MIGRRCFFFFGTQGEHRGSAIRSYSIMYFLHSGHRKHHNVGECATHDQTFIQGMVGNE